MKMRILGVSCTCGKERLESDKYAIVNRELTTQLFDYASQPNLKIIGVNHESLQC